MLSHRLRELRNKKGVTQTEIAKLLTITREAYSMYESDKRQMNHESLCILADYYDVSTDFLLGRKEKDAINFSNEEIEMLNKYRCLDDRGKENIKTIVDLEYARGKSKENQKKSVI